MSDYILRMRQEVKELDVKIEALTAFFLTPVFSAIVYEEKVRLRQQHRVMSAYSRILHERVGFACRAPAEAVHCAP